MALWQVKFFVNTPSYSGEYRCAENAEDAEEALAKARRRAASDHVPVHDARVVLWVNHETGENDE